MNKWKRDGLNYTTYFQWEDAVGKRTIKKTMNVVEYWVLRVFRGQRHLDKMATSIPEWAKKWAFDETEV
jgi:hypothetical protein